MRELDGLRAWACLTIMLTHYFPPRVYGAMGHLVLGDIGLRMFLVLSGFLVTAILLRHRNRAGGMDAKFLRNFYARRVLRICPVFYAALLGLWLAGYPGINEALPWHLLFVHNFWRVIADVNFVNHFWTLAVLMQFYLVWPFVVLLVPRRRLLPLLATLALGALAYRGVAVACGAGYRHLSVMPFANIDLLAFGGMLALFLHEPQACPHVRRRFGRLGLWLGGAAALLLLGLLTAGLIGDVLWTVLFNTAGGFFCVGLIDAGARGAFPMGHCLLRPLTGIGRISYGLYVLHPLVWYALLHLHRAHGLPLPDGAWARLPLFFAAAVLTAALSWRCFELPLNRLKRHFPYSARV